MNLTSRNQDPIHASLALSSLLSFWYKPNSLSNKSIYNTLLLEFYICAKPRLTHWYPCPKKKCHYFCTGVYGVTTKQHQRSKLLALCEGNPSSTGGLPSQMPVTRKAFSYHDDVILTNRHNYRRNLHRENMFDSLHSRRPRNYLTQSTKNVHMHIYTYEY